MCFDLDSAPPIPTIAGAAVSHRELVLASPDTSRFLAFGATPDEPSGVGVVILPDNRGLTHFYEELALRFAERGHTAIAIDYFGRSAGTDARGEDFDPQPHLDQTQPVLIQIDVHSAVDWLRAEGCTSNFTVGFCFGGRNSWISAAGGHGLKGAVGFYGMPGLRKGAPGPTQMAGVIEAPILALQAGDDAHITQEMNDEFDAALTAEGVEHEVVVYPGAPHSFFDKKQDEFAEASEDAWARTLAFIDGHR